MKLKVLILFFSIFIVIATSVETAMAQEPIKIELESPREFDPRLLEPIELSGQSTLLNDYAIPRSGLVSIPVLTTTGTITVAHVGSGCLDANGEVPAGFIYHAMYDATGRGLNDYWGGGHAIPVMSRYFRSPLRDDTRVKFICMKFIHNGWTGSTEWERVFFMLRQHKVKIFTTSWKFTFYCQTNFPIFRDLLDSYLADGGIYIPSAGNDGAGNQTCPAKLAATRPGMLPVGSVESDGLPSDWSSDNPYGVSWSGSAVPVQNSSGQTMKAWGSSYTVYNTATVAAWVWLKHPEYSGVDVVNVMKQNAAALRGRPGRGIPVVTWQFLEVHSTFYFPIIFNQ